MSENKLDSRFVREQQENEILRRVLFWLGAAVVLETLVLLCNRFYFNGLVSELGIARKIYDVMQVLQFAGVVVALGFVIWALVGRKKDASGGICRIISAAFFFGISICSFLVLHIGNGSISVLLVAIPAMAGLIMIYYLYQREFFMLATLAGLGILGLWVYRIGSVQYRTLYFVYALLVCCVVAAVILFTMRLKKSDGELHWKERTLTILKPEANYTMLWICGAMVVAFLLLAPLLGTVFAYYAFLALIVWIFVMAVYFTSRLM